MMQGFFSPQKQGKFLLEDNIKLSDAGHIVLSYNSAEEAVRFKKMFHFYKRNSIL